MAAPALRAALTRGTIQGELMAILLADRILLMSNGSETDAGYRPGNIAETVVNPLPRQRTRAKAT